MDAGDLRSFDLGHVWEVWWRVEVGKWADCSLDHGEKVGYILEREGGRETFK